MVALDHGLRVVAIPAMEVWKTLLPDAKLVAHEDNAVALRVCQTGKNQAMRHLGRTHGITVAWLHETHSRVGFELVYASSAMMAADVFTKAFTNPHAWESACSL